MELFSKIYGCYYQVVEQILNKAIEEPIKSKQMIEIANTYAYQESALMIVPKLVSGEWALLKEEGKDYFVSKVGQIAKLPFTTLQKAWIKSLLQDKRILLFLSDKDLRIIEQALENIETLYQIEDFYFFDQYTDGDNYMQPNYRKNFRLLLMAIENQEINLNEKIFHVVYLGKLEKKIEIDIIPYRIQYSAKNNKFRVNCIQIFPKGYGEIITLNIGKILSCIQKEKREEIEINLEQLLEKQKAKEPVLIEISGERNSLERCMLHFASYEKRTEYNEEKKVYLCSIYYDRQDETELLIEILSFGPVIHVLGPKDFLRQIKQRVCRQHELFNIIL